MDAKMGQWTQRFIIRPSESLKSKTAQWQSELKELLLQTALWSKTEGHRTSWTNEDRIAQVKLLFVASLKQYSTISDFEGVIGGLTLSTKTFEKWWTIESVNDVETVEEVEEGLESIVIDQIELTGKPLVDGWLSDLRRTISTKAH